MNKKFSVQKQDPYNTTITFQKYRREIIVYSNRNTDQGIKTVMAIRLDSKDKQDLIDFLMDKEDK